MALHNISIYEIYFIRGMMKIKIKRISVRMRIRYKASQTQTLSEALLALKRETLREACNVGFDMLLSTGQPVSFLLLEVFEDDERLLQLRG